MAMQPAHPGAVGHVDRHFEGQARHCEPRLDGGDQRVGPLARDRGNQDRAGALPVPRGQVFEPRPLRGIDAVDLVPDLDDAGIGRLDAEVAQDLSDIMGLGLGVAMGDVADMEDQVGLDHLFQRGAEGRHQRGRQVRDEADGVGQDDPVAARQDDRAQRRIEGGEQHVGREHRRAGQPIEQRRLSGIGVADQRNDRIRHAFPAVAVELAGPLHALQFALDLGDALGDQPAVGLDLGLAGTAEKAEAAALALQMGPGPHQAAALIIEMGELDLQRALPRPRPPAEDFEDQAGAVEHLGVPGLLQVALLHRRQRAIHHHDPGLVGFHQARQLLHLALAEIGRGPQLRQRHQAGVRPTSRSMASARPTASSSRASGALPSTAAVARSRK